MNESQLRQAFRDCEYAFHRAWTRAVDEPGYQKRQWQDLHNALLRVWRFQATTIGIPPNEPL